MWTFRATSCTTCFKGAYRTGASTFIDNMSKEGATFKTSGWQPALQQNLSRNVSWSQKCTKFIFNRGSDGSIRTPLGELTALSRWVPHIRRCPISLNVLGRKILSPIPQSFRRLLRFSLFSLGKFSTGTREYRCFRLSLGKYATHDKFGVQVNVEGEICVLCPSGINVLGTERRNWTQLK